MKGIKPHKLPANLQIKNTLSKALILSLICVGMLLLQQGTSIAGTTATASKRTTFTLWQLPSQIDSILMSYVIRTANGKIIVLDGGQFPDAPYLKSFLSRFGGNVDAWFISHAHEDHFDALKEILLNPGDIKIKKIYGLLSDEEWVNQYAQESIKSVKAFNSALRSSHQNITTVTPGEVIDIDGVRVEVLSTINPEIHVNAINNSSIVYKMSDKKKSILFLGDLGYEGGEKLLHSKYADKIHSAYVQMAHHGQNGVGEDVYKAVNPSYCLWPTPSWLWNNDSGKGKNSGPWKTLEVRRWMQKLNIKRNYVAVNGLYRID